MGFYWNAGHRIGKDLRVPGIYSLHLENYAFSIITTICLYAFMVIHEPFILIKFAVYAKNGHKQQQKTQFLHCLLVVSFVLSPKIEHTYNTQRALNPVTSRFYSHEKYTQKHVRRTVTTKYCLSAATIWNAKIGTRYREFDVVSTRFFLP